MLLLGATAVAGHADPPPDSVLLADPTSVTVNVYDTPALGDPAHTATVTLGLDPNCSNAIGVTKYTIVPGVSSYVSVSPASSAALDCDDTATFTVTGVAVTPASPPDTLLNFAAVAANNGLQKKIGGTNIVIVVVDTTPEGGGGCEQTSTCPPSGERPAAPAVANAYLNSNPQAAAACKAAYGTKDWRGRVISKVAADMPKPESVKDDTDEYPLDSDWINFVTTTLVDPQCIFNQA
jgi:hypothetical protein